MIIYAGTNGYLDDLAVEDVRPFEKSLYEYVDSMNPGLLTTIETKKALDDAIKADMNKTLKEAKERFLAEKGAAVAAAR
jgi:F-type H+/Na+-transporting ATPase subunit alpha